MYRKQVLHRAIELKQRAPGIIFAFPITFDNPMSLHAVVLGLLKKRK